VDDEKAEFCLIEAPVRILHGHRAGNTLPVPAPWEFLPCPAWLFEQERQHPVLLAPCLHLLAYSTRTRHQCDEPHPPLDAQAKRAFTIGLTISHNAVHSVEAEGQTLFNGYGSLRTVAGIAITNSHAEREALTAHAKTQEHLLEIITAIFAVPIGRTRRDQPFDRAGLLLIGPVESDCRRILMEPWGRDGIDLQGVEGDSPKHAVEMGGKQGIEDLPQPVIMERGACEAGLE
jgi:hypothetical protein